MTSQRPRSSGRPTLDEVAARAGVGRGTVSRVINGLPRVSAQARAAVEKAIAELGYVPNLAARALVRQRTDSVALVVSESGERVFGEPFFAGIVRGVNAALMQTELQLWLALTQSPEQRVRVERHLTSQHVDGVMLLSLHDADPLPAVLLERGLPTVLGGRTGQMLGSGQTAVSWVDVDNVAGARSAVQHLLGLARRQVATIAGPQDMGVGVARLAGYREALAADRLAWHEDLVAYGDFSEESGAAAMSSLLERRPDLDAVFAASDLMAVGAMRVLRERQRRVPQDVAVIGFEDSAIAKQTDPPLTTVHQPVGEMGRQMVDLLTARITGAEPTSVLLPTRLVRRGSA